MNPSESLGILLLIAKNTPASGQLSLTTGSFASHLQISQQSASRKLRELNTRGLIDAQASAKGYEITLAPKGEELLKNTYLALSSFFETPQKKELSALVTSGLGEGAYYVSQPHYKKQFEEFLQSQVYLGTLNLVVNKNHLDFFLNTQQPKVIPGFETKERTFGRTTYYNARLNDSIDVGLILPERTAHRKNIVEIIAKEYLRGELNLKDGSKVKISLR